MAASLSYGAVQHLAYEVQAITFCGSSSLTSGELASGFRLRFEGTTTYVTEDGGYYGCMNAASTAAKV